MGRVTWRAIAGKGRGVVAVGGWPAGTELERSPVIPCPFDHLVHRPDDPTVPEQYFLHWSDDPGQETCMGGGLLMFYNHGANPNIEFRGGPEPETMSVFALRDVVDGEELVYDYDVELWFTPAPE